MFDAEKHAAVKVTWAAYHDMKTAYRCGNRAAGRQRLDRLTESLATEIPTALAEPKKHGSTLSK